MYSFVTKAHTTPNLQLFLSIMRVNFILQEAIKRWGRKWSFIDQFDTRLSLNAFVALNINMIFDESRLQRGMIKF